MSNENDSRFSKSLLSLQLQLKTLLEEVGGERAVELLDSLAKLNKSEQEVVLSIMVRTLSDILGGQVRLSTPSDEELEAFEQQLYSDLVQAMRDASEPEGSPKLSVLDGGKCTSRGPIDFRRALEQRKRRLELVN